MFTSVQLNTFPATTVAGLEADPKLNGKQLQDDNWKDYWTPKNTLRSYDDVVRYGGIIYLCITGLC